MEGMPFRVPMNTQVSQLSAGEKQKLEILKLLYLDQRFMILDEPTSVLTPGEADERLGLLRGMAARKEITVLMISHKFREVKAFCDHFTVLRRGQFTGSGDAKTATIAEMSSMMIGDSMSELATPPLTTIDFPAEELGRTAARNLVDRLDSGDATLRQVFVRPGLTVRGTTAPPAAR